MKFSLLFSTILISGLFSCNKKLEIAQWRGPDRTGVYNETNLLQSWPEGGPALLWDVADLGLGYSSVTVTGEAIFVTGRKDSTEVLSKLELNGKMLWQTPYGKAWDQSFPDSRCAPTVEGDLVFVTAGMGDFVCINEENGEMIWSMNAMEKFGGVYGSWGIAESPLIVNDKVIFTPGGKTTMVALNKNTGETLWASESLNDTVAYVSPRLVNFAGKQIIISVLERNIVGVDASNGKILWYKDFYNFESKACIAVGDWAPKINANTPLYKDGCFYVTGGYNHVGAKFKIAEDGNSVSLVWVDSTLDVHHGNVVLVEGYIYGANWLNNRFGKWCCIDWKSGKTMWETEWNTKGSIIANINILYILDEMKGNVGLVKANLQKFELVSSFIVPKGKGPYWAHMVIADGVLYIRHGEVLMAYDIKQK